ncbi:MAG: hypothetical protein MUP81_00135 [Dehalococcoidia bacterium]|nr:hypothetical protein [Dehalococcoidia bacterium]
MNSKLFDSKKAKMAFLGASSAAITEFVIIFLKNMGIEVPQEVILMVLAPFLAYIGGKSAADIAYNITNGKNGTKTVVSVPAPIRIPIIPGESGTAKYFEPPVKPDIGGQGSARRAFEAWQRADFEITAPFGIGQYESGKVEREVLYYYEKQLELARDLYIEVRGQAPPEVLVDSCSCGDFSYEHRQLVHSARELQQIQDYFASIKKDRAKAWQLGGIGYLIHSVPWGNIPEWAQKNIRMHTKGDPLRTEMPSIIY